MIEPFAQQAWADAHEKLSSDVTAGLARLAGWLRRRAKLEHESPAAASPRGKPRRPKQGAPPADAGGITAKTDAPDASGA